MNFLEFRSVAKAENIRFKKNILFTTPKQFKEAIIEYAIHGTWGIIFAQKKKKRFFESKSFFPTKLQVCSLSNKGAKGEELPTKNIVMDHTCFKRYKNPMCTSSYIGKKSMKKVKRQPNIKLKDIQDVVQAKYVVNISAGKISRTRGIAQEYVGGAYF